MHFGYGDEEKKMKKKLIKRIILRKMKNARNVYRLTHF